MCKWADPDAGGGRWTKSYEPSSGVCGEFSGTPRRPRGKPSRTILPLSSANARGRRFSLLWRQPRCRVAPCARLPAAAAELWRASSGAAQGVPRQQSVLIYVLIPTLAVVAGLVLWWDLPPPTPPSY